MHERQQGGTAWPPAGCTIAVSSVTNADFDIPHWTIDILSNVLMHFKHELQVLLLILALILLRWRQGLLQVAQLCCQHIHCCDDHVLHAQHSRPLHSKDELILQRQHT